MGIARNGEIPEIEVDGKRFEVKQSHPRTAENARNGGSGQLGKLELGLAGQVGEAASWANWSWGWPGKVRKRAFARLQQSCSHERTGNPSGNGSFIKKVGPGHKMCLRQ